VAPRLPALMRRDLAALAAVVQLLLS